jgi:hypothetical protein
MFSLRASRVAATAAALHLVLGAGVAAAQTIIVRKAPPGSTVEVTVNGAAAGTATVDANGDAVVRLTTLTPGARTEMDAYLFVEQCDTVRRILIVDRTAQAPPANADCQRHDLPGLFLVRRASSLVFDVSASPPTVLLRQGSYSLKPPRVWKPAPTGFVVFGSSGIGKFSNASLIACGNVEGCEGDHSGVPLSAGAAYWFTKWLGAEVSYMKPAEATATVRSEAFTFDTVLDAEIVNVSAKLGVPFGPSRFFGNIGTSYHRALARTTQTAGSITDSFELQTDGWSWSWSGGFEIWLASSFALYAEGGSIGLKGDAINVEEGLIDDRFTFALAGARIRIGW